MIKFRKKYSEDTDMVENTLLEKGIGENIVLKILLKILLNNYSEG